jgi:heme/copper-type cytochrome/quinol oxidase subunit 2
MKMNRFNLLGFALVMFILIPFPFIFYWYDDFRTSEQLKNNIIEIEGWVPEDGGWIPDNIQLKVGQTYTFIIMANDVSHGFLASDLDIS